MAGPNIDRDHIVHRPWWYSAMIVFQMLSAAGIFPCLFPYVDSTFGLVGLQRFFIFVAVSSWITGTYYLISYYLLPPAYCCWAWLICCCWQLLMWAASWVDITLTMGRLASGDENVHNNVWYESELPEAIGATAISTMNAFLCMIILVAYSRAVHRHRRKGAPYVFHGRWRPTDFTLYGQRNGTARSGPPARPRHVMLPVQNYELVAPRGAPPPTPPREL